MRSERKQKILVVLLSMGLTAAFAACCLGFQLFSIRHRVQDRADRYFRSIEASSEAQMNISSAILRQREDALLRLTQYISAFYDEDTFRSALKSPADQVELLQKICDTSPSVELLLVTDDGGTACLSSRPEMIGGNVTESGLFTQESFDSLLKRENASAFTGEHTVSVLIYNDGDGTHIYAPYASSIQMDGKRFHLIALADFVTLNGDSTDVQSGDILLNTGSSDLFSIAVRMSEYADLPGGSIYYCKQNGVDYKNLLYSDIGLTEKALQDGYAGYQRINGVLCYCRGAVCRHYDNDFLFIIAGSIPQMLDLPALLCPIAFMAWLCLYISTLAFTRSHQLAIPLVTPLQRLFAITAAGVLAIFGIAFFSRTLAGLSSASRQTEPAHQLLVEEIEDIYALQETAQEASEQIALSQMNLIRITVEMQPASYFASTDPDAYREYAVTGENGYSEPLLDEMGHPLRAVCRSEGLQALCNDFGLTRVTLYNADGYTVADSSGEWYGHIARDLPETQALFDVLDRKKDALVSLSEGEENLLWIAMPMDYYVRGDANETVYVARDEYLAYQQDPEGMPPVRHRYGLIVCRQAVPEILFSTKADAMDFVISSREKAQDCRFMIADASDAHILYYGGDRYGAAADGALPDTLFSNNNSGFITRDGQRYFFCTRQYNGALMGDMVFISLYPLSALHAFRMEISLALALAAALLLIVLVLLRGRHVRKLIASNRLIKTVRAKRDHDLWITPAVLLPFGVAFAWAMNGRWQSSVLRYILGGTWMHGVNLFSLSMCVILLAALVLLSWLMRYGEKFLSLLSARGETMARLIVSVLKYASAIFAFFYSLYLFGLDTASVLRSLGVFSLIVGFGAQSLIQDIITGVFMVFEGACHVGDIVRVCNDSGNSMHGKVVEISMRTLKLEDLEGTVMIFTHSSIKKIENLSLYDSSVFFDLHIPIQENPDEIREKLIPRLDEITKRYREIHGRIEYDGIIETNPDGYTVRLTVHCHERDRGYLWRKINREIVYLVQSLDLH